MENVIRMHGTGHAGRLPPVVSSLFSVKAAHWSDGIRRTELGARARSGRHDSAALSVMGSQLLRGAGEPPPPKATDAPGTPASAGTQLSSIGRIPTGRGIEWLEILDFAPAFA